jgi:hypothetical protein
MNKRDYVAEILEKRGRQPNRSLRWEQAARRLEGVVGIPGMFSALAESTQDVDLDFEVDARVEREIVRHVPIGLVACIEGFFRMVIADLIDFGPPYRDNAARLTNVTFSLETALSIQSASVTIGEFVAHLVPLSNLNDVNKVMSTLLGADFLQKFKEIRAVQPRQMTLFPELANESDGDVVNAVCRTFALRHIICHELAPHLADEPWTVRADSELVVEFLWISELLVRESTCASSAPVGKAG